jgi:uncharacterized SAM-binding protein YcdF (DUF218 family)
MKDLFDIIKALIDPIFVIFILLIISLIVFWKASKNKTGMLVLLLTLVLFYAASTFPVANYLCRYLEKDYFEKTVAADQNRDVIVVLGGGSHDINYIGKTFPSPSTVARVAYAVDFYLQNPIKYFVCSGKGPGKVPEAEMMAELAASLSVPQEKIKIDPRSVNTWQSAVEINKMFINKDIRVGLVTSAYHMKRSEREFKKYFNNVSPLPAGFLYSSPMGNPVVRYIPQSEALYKTQRAFQEIIARTWYLLKGLF